MRLFGFAKRSCVVMLAAGCMAAVAASARAADANAPIDPAHTSGTIKVACVGDSITFGYDVSRGNSYPEQLQRMMGDKYDVQNFGVNATTLLNKGDRPYQKTKRFKDALKFKPDVVVIMLGANDTKPVNWAHAKDFAADYKNLIAQFAALDSHPRIWIMRPTPVPGAGNYGINEADVEQEIPWIDAVAKEKGTGEIDAHAALVGKDNLFKDRVHPDTAGATVLAATVYKALEGKDYSGPPVVKTARRRATTRPAQ